jgi:adenosylmethionine-8-amino-7-oxononanoate aminotransferase
MGDIFHRKLAALKALPGVGDVRGLGLLAGIELVSEKAGKKPYARRLRLAETFTELAQDNGLIVWPNVGQTAEEEGDIIMLAPPFIINEAELDEIIARFTASLKNALEAIHDYSSPV